MAVLTVLYDEGCGFCTRMALRIARPARVDVAPIGSPKGSVFLRDLPPAERYAAFHVVNGSGRRFTGGAALGPLARSYPGGAALAVAFDAFPRLTERAYGLLARNRGLVSMVLRL
jgi:predicted DCC family thiol-disulfide oxidoreductase YuxK